MPGEFGELVVNVRSGRDSFAVPGTRVIVYEINKNGERNVVSILETDVSGSTPVIRLPAPDKDLSLSPGSTQERASRYFIKSEKDGFYTVENDFVPIYSGVRAIQNVELVPYAFGSEFELPDKDRIIDENFSPDL